MQGSVSVCLWSGDIILVPVQQRIPKVLGNLPHSVACLQTENRLSELKAFICFSCLVVHSDLSEGDQVREIETNMAGPTCAARASPSSEPPSSLGLTITLRPSRSKTSLRPRPPLERSSRRRSFFMVLKRLFVRPIVCMDVPAHLIDARRNWNMWRTSGPVHPLPMSTRHIHL